ncbi:ABC transporter permease [Catenuloplanes sp. NPDC051500]|uniref:ABC transporter permease n=1 Tax=Catenuloplanes sp. NPDC051500 TaxID=3363959 RepID=UPI0037A21627
MIGALRDIALRAVGAVGVLFGAATLAFAALQLVPGDPVAVLLGPATSASPEVRAQIVSEYGFDRPVAEQYLHYLGRLVQGDLGESYQLQRPVAALIGAATGPTAQLAAAALAIAAGLALLSALATAGRRPALRALATVAELVPASTPSYWVGIVLLTFLSFRFRLFPVAGDAGPAALVLPAVTLALPLAGVLAQVLRESLEAALAQPFVVTARARGIGEHAVRLRHALRHAAVPLLTLTGWITGTLFGGAVLVETIFGRPGLGALTLAAVSSKDMPVVIGVTLLSALVFVALSTAVDLLVTAVDPRLRNG